MPSNENTPTSNSGLDKDYQALLQELQSIFAKGHHTAAKPIDNIKVQT